MDGMCDVLQRDGVGSEAQSGMKRVAIVCYVESATGESKGTVRIGGNQNGVKHLPCEQDSCHVVTSSPSQRALELLQQVEFGAGSRRRLATHHAQSLSFWLAAVAVQRLRAMMQPVPLRPSVIRSPSWRFHRRNNLIDGI